ncbi:MAG: c-type cytochrome [Rubrivivax sp.]|nr:c-type cytochrome [Rubrivivax sp.]
MKRSSRQFGGAVAVCGFALGVALGNAWAADPVDANAAQALLKRNDCGKCHAVDKKKDGPPYKETAAKLKGKADAEAQLVKHLTSSPKVKIDGKEEEHKAIKGSDAEVLNLVRWILSR